VLFLAPAPQIRSKEVIKRLVKVFVRRTRPFGRY